MSLDLNKPLAVGADFGALAGRALVFRVSDGAELGSAVHSYPHLVIDDVLPGTEVKLFRTGHGNCRPAQILKEDPAIYAVIDHWAERRTGLSRQLHAKRLHGRLHGHPAGWEVSGNGAEAVARVQQEVGDPHPELPRNELVVWTADNISERVPDHDLPHRNRDFGYIQTRLGVARKTVAGHLSDAKEMARIGAWQRAATCVMGCHVMVEIAGILVPLLPRMTAPLGCLHDCRL